MRGCITRYLPRNQVRDEIVQMLKGVVCAALCPAASVCLAVAVRDKSDCHFRKAATEYDRKPGIKRLSCTAK